MTTSRDIENFFSNYALKFSEILHDKSNDGKSTTSDFAECVIGANPTGVICGKNDKEFEAVISRGYEFYRSIGITSMEIVSIKTTMLDDFHWMARVTWRSNYSAKNIDGKIVFEVIYFVQIREGQIKIFAYITGDEQKALRGSGLI